jgi:hypothetical protein
VFFFLGPASGCYEHLGSLNTSCSPSDMTRALIPARLDSTGIWLRPDFSPRPLGYDESGKQKSAQADHEYQKLFSH